MALTLTLYRRRDGLRVATLVVPPNKVADDSIGLLMRISRELDRAEGGSNLYGIRARMETTSQGA